MRERWEWLTAGRKWWELALIGAVAAVGIYASLKGWTASGP